MFLGSNLSYLFVRCHSFQSFFFNSSLRYYCFLTFDIWSLQDQSSIWQVCPDMVQNQEEGNKTLSEKLRVELILMVMTILMKVKMMRYQHLLMKLDKLLDIELGWGNCFHFPDTLPMGTGYSRPLWPGNTIWRYIGVMPSNFSIKMLYTSQLWKYMDLDLVVMSTALELCCSLQDNHVLPQDHQVFDEVFQLLH